MVEIDSLTGLMKSVPYLASSHCDERPIDEVIDMIVIHGISLPPAQWGGEHIEHFFCGTLNPTSHPYFLTIAELRVSSHLLIKREGDIVQFVPFTKRAWHAGVSFFQGRQNCNDFSIGIELEGTDDLPYEKIQYEKLANIISVLRMTYSSITEDRVIGHSDIAPGRKTDPGPSFDWLYLQDLLARIRKKQ